MEEARLLAKTAAAGRGDAWIGLRFDGTPRWLWSDGSGAPTSTYWEAEEPSFDDQNPCVEATKEGWNDVKCTWFRPLVCQGGESKPFLCDLRFTKFHLQIVMTVIQTFLNINEHKNVMERVRSHVRDFPNRGSETRTSQTQAVSKRQSHSTRNKL